MWPHRCSLCSLMCQDHIETCHASCNDTAILPSSYLSRPMPVFKHSLCVYSLYSSSDASPNIVALLEPPMVLRLKDNAHLLIADDVMVIPTKPPLLFPVACSHSVLWSAATWLNWRSVCITTKLPSRNSWRTSCGWLDIRHNVIKWKHFPRYWSFVRPVTRSFDVFFDLHLNERLRLVIWDNITPITASQ